MTIKILKPIISDLFDPSLDDPRLRNTYMKDEELDKYTMRRVDDYDDNLDALDPNDDRVDDEVDLNIDHLVEEDINDENDTAIEIVKTPGVEVKRHRKL